MKCAKDIHETILWPDLTPGCEIYEGGTSALTKTGEWRVVTPKRAVRPFLPGQLHPRPRRPADRL